MTTGRTGGADELKPRTKAARLRALMGLIEAKLKEGVQHADILRWLNGEGLELTERTYQSYLYRYRKTRRTGARARSEIAQPSGAPAPRSQPVGQRPRSFNYDPKGNPDLLK